MEQKHIDEIDESFLGEEFIEEEDLTKKEEKSSVVKSPATLMKKEKESKEKMSKTMKKSETMKKSVKSKDIAKKVSKLTKEEVKEVKMGSDPKVMVYYDTEKEDIKISPVKEEISITSVETPKANLFGEDVGEGMFKKVSTWKALAVIAVLLLLLSVFTQGFGYSKVLSNSGKNDLSAVEAQATVQDFVNNQLLRPPFVAEVTHTEEANNGLYKVSLRIGEEVIDSYVTKDGQLFFPQGLDLNGVSTLDELGVAGNETLTGVSNESAAGGMKVSAPEVEVTGVEASPVAEQNEVAVPSTGETVTATIQAKKWIFTPNKVTVNQGDKVELIVVPEDISFTFAVPELNVVQEISGTTTVKFVAGKAGSLKFTCSSCEDWRGMSGTLIVK